MSTSSSADEDRWNKGNKSLSTGYLQKMQNQKFELFKTQDLEKGAFDVTFEVEGKKLFAHKFTLIAVSETMGAMLSDRWSTKDEAIKIETCTFDNFYQFLCFIYSGNCFLKADNVYQLVDIAEFYGVPCLKEYCDKFLHDMKKTADTIEELYDFAVKYSLSCCMDSIKGFVRYGHSEMYADEIFRGYKKSFIEFLSTINRGPDYFIKGSYDYSTDKNESGFFECVYKWAEHQALKQKSIDDENFDLQKAIKTQLETILPNIKFCNMNLRFLMDVVVEKEFLLSPDDFDSFFAQFRARKNNDNEEILFKSIYELTENQALKKQKVASDPGNFNVADSIKADLAKIIPRFKFYDMDKQFLMDFVVAKGIITEEQANHVYDTRVEIKNDGKIITGLFKDVYGIREAVQKIHWHSYCGNSTNCRFTKLKFAVPSTPSTVTKMKGNEWYLCLGTTGILAFKQYSAVRKNDYLIAEMKSDTEFQLISDEAIRLTASYRNLYGW